MRLVVDHDDVSASRPARDRRAHHLIRILGEGRSSHASAEATLVSLPAATFSRSPEGVEVVMRILAWPSRSISWAGRMCPTGGNSYPDRWAAAPVSRSRMVIPGVAIRKVLPKAGVLRIRGLVQRVPCAISMAMDHGLAGTVAIFIAMRGRPGLD